MLKPEEKARWQEFLTMAKEAIARNANLDDAVVDLAETVRRNEVLYEALREPFFFNACYVAIRDRSR